MRIRSYMCVGLAISLAAVSAAACKSSGSGSSSGKTLVIATDLPLQGSNKDTSDSTNKMIQLYLDSVGGKAGSYKVTMKAYDDSTAATGAWDPATCTKNANAHVANSSEIAVMGTYNSGCAKLEVPILNAAQMLMVSDANTNPGLTKAWDPGEPDKYYPSGKRNYARIPTTDDYQGTADSRFAAED